MQQFLQKDADFHSFYFGSINSKANLILLLIDIKLVLVLEPGISRLIMQIQFMRSIDTYSLKSDFTSDALLCGIYQTKFIVLYEFKTKQD